MASKGKAPENSARLRKRQDNGSSYSSSMTSDNAQNDEHVGEIFQSPVSVTVLEDRTCIQRTVSLVSSVLEAKLNNFSTRQMQVLLSSLSSRRLHLH